MATFVQEGSAVDYTPTSAVAAGAVVVQGDLVGVARAPIAANALGSLAVGGVFDFPKATGVGSGIAVGKKVHWKADPGVATTDTDDGGDPKVEYAYIGKVVKAAADADATVRVRLSQ